MTWKQATPVLQITIALNAAYFSFPEIRARAFSGFGRKLDKIEGRLAAAAGLLATIPKPTRATPIDEATSLWIRRDTLEAEVRMHATSLQGYREPYSEKMQAFDRGIRVASLCAAVLGFVLLILASMYPKSAVGSAWFLLATVICLAPTIMSVVYNLMILRLLKQTAADVTSIGESVDRVWNEVSTTLVVRGKILSASEKS